MRQLLLTRHAESEYNAALRINADPLVASPLTALGRAQAGVLAEFLADEPIDLCVTSEIPRARETADIVLRGRDVARATLPDLNDPRAGTLEGGPVSDYVAWLRENGPHEPNPGGGESQMDALRRYVRAYRWIGARPDAVILVIAHGLPVAWLRAALSATETPTVDFEHPAVELAGQPLRVDPVELERAVRILDAVASGIIGR
jgi:probable phosphoglycerate mutase